MTEVETKLSELKKNNRTFLLVSTIYIALFYFLYLKTAELSIFGFQDYNLIYLIVFLIGVAGYLTGTVFFTLSLYRAEKFFGESEFKESRNGKIYTNKRHMFKAGLISDIVLLSSSLAFIVIQAIILLI